MTQCRRGSIEDFLLFLGGSFWGLIVFFYNFLGLGWLGQGDWDGTRA